MGKNKEMMNMKNIREVKYTGVKSMGKTGLKDGEKVRLITPDDYEWVSYWVWSFRIKSEDEKDPIHSHTWQGIFLKLNKETNEIYFLLEWEKGYDKARFNRTAWVPEGVVKLIKLDDLEVLDKRYIEVWRMGHKVGVPYRIG